MPDHVNRSLFDRVFRNPDTGEIVVAQPPNPPLSVFLVATLIRLVFHPRGGVGTAVSVVGGVALAWWAIAEIGWGVSLFRRLLGAVVLVAVVAGWIVRSVQ